MGLSLRLHVLGWAARYHDMTPVPRFVMVDVAPLAHLEYPFNNFREPGEMRL